MLQWRVCPGAEAAQSASQSLLLDLSLPDTPHNGGQPALDAFRGQSVAPNRMGRIDHRLSCRYSNGKREQWHFLSATLTLVVYLLGACKGLAPRSPNRARRPGLGPLRPQAQIADPNGNGQMVKLHIGCAWLAASHFEIVIGIPTFSIRPMVVWNRMLRIRKVVRSHTVSFTE